MDDTRLALASSPSKLRARGWMRRHRLRPSHGLRVSTHDLGRRKLGSWENMLHLQARLLIVASVEGWFSGAIDVSTVLASGDGRPVFGEFSGSILSGGQMRRWY